MGTDVEAQTEREEKFFEISQEFVDGLWNDEQAPPSAANRWKWNCLRQIRLHERTVHEVREHLKQLLE